MSAAHHLYNPLTQNVLYKLWLKTPSMSFLFTLLFLINCSYVLDLKSLSFLADGELYTGTASNFQGNEPVIYKSLGQGAALKTENSLKWLQGNSFYKWQTI